MNTSDFRTKTEFTGEKHVAAGSFWPIALDIGYSAVKGYSQNNRFCFPSYARKIGKKSEVIGTPAKNEILYHDMETNDVWRVGAAAQESVGMGTTDDSREELFGQTRYFTQMFGVIARCGLAFGMMNTSSGPYNKLPPYLQTGLPPAYLEREDKQYLIDALAGHHHFAIMTGDRTTEYDFDLPEEHIGVMAQPEGTLMSLSMDDNARSVRESRDYFASNILFADAGFETLDYYELYDRKIRSKGTYENFCMREILDRTSAKIKEQYGIMVEQTAMQNVLEKGSITRYIRKKGVLKPQPVTYPVTEILEQVTKEVCAEVIEKTMNSYNGLENYKYLVLTGGTFAPWEEDFREFFSEMKELKILMGNHNCSSTTPLIYTNVRGYYMYLINRLRKLEKEAAKS